MVAGFWQANPTLTAQQVIAALRSTASQATTPDNTLGYGIPNFVTAYNALHPNTPLAHRQCHGEAEAWALYPNPSGDGPLTLVLPAALRGQPLRVRVLDARGARGGAAAAAGHHRQPRLPCELGRLAKGAYTCEVSAGNYAGKR